MTEGSLKKFCVIVPAYQEEARIGRTVEGIRKYCDHVVVIDDGSTDNTSAEAERAGAVVVKHDVNTGKGTALNSGFKYARDFGCDFLITMDADGQHAPEDIPHFIDTYVKTGTPVLVGNRMTDPGDMPLVRRLTNRFMSRLLSRKMKQHVPDTQCGFRLYRCDLVRNVPSESGRYAAESEVLLALSGEGIQIGSVPIKVIYNDEKSKINPVMDTIRFFGMLRRYRQKRQ